MATLDSNHFNLMLFVFDAKYEGNVVAPSSILKSVLQ